MRGKNKLLFELRKQENKDKWVCLMGKTVVKKPLNGDTLFVGFFELLTKKQKDVLVKLIEFNYYKYPRTMSLNKFAEKIGISASTLCVHIQKIESKMIPFVYTRELQT